ncbi:MFS transporter [Scandinavium manionii]|uniref:MFS transporter n=1 Tax=Scandinavium manionii TaxID=2926520 RepID=UPI001358F270|nr:MFS transporter [Scandinavium manionii]MCS2164211.1 MFS transporter [Scandinavium manionii]
MNKWIIEFVLYAVYMIFGAAWATTGVVMPQIMADFTIDVSHAALMSNVILWAKIIGAVGTSVLTVKLGARKSYLLGCLLTGLSVLIPWTNNFELLLAIRFLGGLGGAICLVSLVPTVARFFENKTASALNSLNCTSNIVGTIIALTLTASLSLMFGGWRNLLAMYGVITLFLGALWFIFFSDETVSSKQTATAFDMKELKEAVFNRVVWGMVAQYVGAMIMMVFMFTFLPLYYDKYAHLPVGSYAHFSGTVNQVGIMLGAIIGPFFKNRGYHYKNWLFISSIVMAITTFIMLFATNDLLILSCSFITGFVFATWFAFIFSIPKESVQHASTRRVTYMMSTFWVSTFILATINSQIIAMSVDITGGFTVGFSWVFALMVISPLLALLIFPKKASLLAVQH